MIATISGKVTEKTEDYIIIENNGIGYQLLVPVGELETASIGSDSRYYIYEHIREDTHDLFGFSKLEDKVFFEKLIGVNGVGPKMAIALFSIDASRLRNAIAGGDTAVLTQAPGIGKRKAERIIVDLKDKVSVVPTAAGSAPSNNETVLNALTGLGYNRKQAEEAIRKLPEDIDTDENKVKAALKELS